MRRQIVISLLIIALTFGGIFAGFYGAAWLHSNGWLEGDAPATLGATEAAHMLAASTPSQAWRTRVPPTPPATRAPAPTKAPWPTAVRWHSPTPRPSATPRPAATPTATPADTPIPVASSTPPFEGTPTATRTATAAATATATRTAQGGISRPPKRCTEEFQIVGSVSFHLSVWDNLSRIWEVSPADYDLFMRCTSDGARTRVRRIVQSDQLYSDSGGTIQMRDGIGPLMASSLLHEGLHITAYGWNVSKSTDCTPENRTLFHQADWLDKAADQETDPGQAEALRSLARWYRDLKDKWNCPAP